MNSEYPYYGNLLTYESGIFMVYGLPKSGNVWMGSLIKNILDIKDTNLYLDKDSKAGIATCHCPNKITFEENQNIKHAIYLIRDIRDLVVSYFHYSQTLFHRERVDPSCVFENLDDFYFDYFLSVVVPKYDVFNQVHYFTSKGIPLVKYESLYDNPTGELLRLFKKLGVDVKIEKVQQAVDAHMIDKLKKDGLSTDYVNIPTTHFRKGGYGNYKEEMSEKVLKDIEERFGSYLKRWGYELSYV